MTSSADRHARHLALAGRITHALTQRAAMAEAVGIMRCWQSCDAVQARRDLVDNGGGVDRQDAEAARVTALVDALADRRADPDWDS
nr:hypothetical protein [Kibdelosporangium sp. MJ126-NF4]CEL18204.1 hypothetical protein [Kibdelosporangium sp. MJ126-NF4]CTQ90565.1 hypothetical protein [Kibdelosporangium sp. MJ126-NF4]